ncbi:MAG: response regulator [Gemmatimonadetes bacterium]|nr:response regulator [Gemmatimonadota bacterium]
MKPAERRDLRVLFVEDDPDDVALLLRELARADWRVEHERVETEEAMRRALESSEWDIVIADHRMPRFSGPAALALVQETGIDLPFIMVSGTIGEELAAESLRAGAEDFLVKDTLYRLVPAIERELRDAEDRRSRRRAEEALHEREKMLLQAQKMEALGRLAGGVAHDFNNLLMVIRGYAELLGQDAANSGRREIEEILAAAGRGADLTRQLLAFSRGTVEESRVVDLHEVVEALERMIRRLLPETIRLEIRLSATKRRVLVDPGRIEQALLNLVVNAQDAMAGGGRLEIETRNPDPDTVEMVVRDTGVGMEPEVVDRIFEPFFTTKEEGDGTGLGLAIVYGVVEHSGGAIAIESRLGEGTAFTIRLPLAAESAARGAAEASSVPAYDS